MNKKMIISAVTIGILLGLFFSRNLIFNMTVPNFEIKDQEIHLDSGMYKYWIYDNNFTNKDIEKIGKATINVIHKQKEKVESLIIFFVDANGKTKKTINFETDEKFLINDNNIQKYKNLYFAIE